MTGNVKIIEVFLDDSKVSYSFCTLVTRIEEYKNMVELFASKGFTQFDCEYLYIDNSKENKLDAYAGYNQLLQKARGRYVILCHQDIEPINDDRTRLDELLTEITRRDPTWGVCGNAGANSNGEVSVVISDPWGENRREGGPFPSLVISLDENFILVRRDANLALSRDMSGYHWYGSDICIVAGVLGWRSYVIDFHLRHKSPGFTDTKYFEARSALKTKLASAFRSRWHYVVTLQPIYVSGSRFRSVIAETYLEMKKLADRLVMKLNRFRHK